MIIWGEPFVWNKEIGYCDSHSGGYLGLWFFGKWCYVFWYCGTPFNVTWFKVFPHLAFSFTDPKSVVLPLILKQNFKTLVTFYQTNQHRIPKDCSLERNEISKCGLIFICCFVLLCRLEDYSNPRTALFVTLTRTFLMEMVVIGVVVAFWLTFKKNSEVNSCQPHYLTAWSRVSLENTVFTRTHLWSLSRATWIQFTPFHSDSFRFILILSSQLCLGKHYPHSAWLLPTIQPTSMGCTQTASTRITKKLLAVEPLRLSMK